MWCVAALALLLESPTAAAERVRVVDQRSMTFTASGDDPHAVLRLTLHVYRFADTRWKEGDIAAALPEVARLLAQCSVALERAELAVVEAPRRHHFYFTPVSRELVRVLQPRKPAVFFVEDTRNHPAFDAEAIGLSNAARRPELQNTVWVAYGTRDLAHALAHELVHVLSDSGDHVTVAGNLMNEDTSPANTRLTPAQCERLRSRGEAGGLLAR